MSDRSPFAQMHRIYERGRRSRGLVVDRDGVALGPDVELVSRSAAGYRCARTDDLVRLTHLVFAGDARLRRLPRVLARIARALDAGDLVKAQLLGLEIPIAELDESQLAWLAGAADLVKAGFDPSQPRNDRGRWTSEGGGDGAAADAAGATPVQIAEASEGISDAGGILPAAADDRGQTSRAVPVAVATIPPPSQGSGNVREYSPEEAAKLPPPPGSKYATLADGAVPWTAPFHELKGGPMLVPKDVSIEDNVRAGEKILADYNKAAETDIREADGARFGTMMRLFDRGGEMDYQSIYGTKDHYNQNYIDHRELQLWSGNGRRRLLMDHGHGRRHGGQLDRERR